jgi:aspartyl-tRNA(Asn)/glutamyl-tRNA(Gln) amidotransferase subunit C
MTDTTPRTSTPFEGEQGAETVRRMAELARLDLGDDEARELGRQFKDIFEHFQVLSQLDVEGVEPMVGATGAVNVLRDDVPVPSLPPERMLAGAPARVGDFYRVPRTVGVEAVGGEE